MAAGPRLPNPTAFFHSLYWGGGSAFKIQIPLIRAGFGLGSELGQGMGCFSLPVAFMFPSCIFPGARLNLSLPGQHAARAHEPKGELYTRHGHNHHGPASSSPCPSLVLVPSTQHPAQDPREGAAIAGTV